MKRTKTENIALFGVMSALAIALSAAESFLMPDIGFLPPGAKPGLSNIVTMFAASCVGVPATLYIVILKAVFGLITRGVTAFFMSLFGGLLSAVVMLVLLRMRKEKVGYVGIGIICAVMHNVGQLCVSVVMTGTFAVLGYAPFLLLFGAVTGFATGSILSVIIPAVKKVIKK